MVSLYPEKYFTYLYYIFVIKHRKLAFLLMLKAIRDIQVTIVVKGYIFTIITQSFVMMIVS